MADSVFVRESVGFDVRTDVGGVTALLDTSTDGVDRSNNWGFGHGGNERER